MELHSVELHSAIFKHLPQNSFELYHQSFDEKNQLNSFKAFPASIKSINPIHPINTISEHYWIICFYSKIFVFMFLLPINVLISFGICSTPKVSK